MLEALERHPGVRLSLHYTGPLLEWLAAERPAFVARLATLVRRGQVELLGGGLYEPVLASLPEHDRVDQLRRMADELERLTGVRPRGAWLAERVWEPDLPTSLVKAGYQWTILDDQHFRAAAIPEQNLWGAYTTEDQGRLLTVFGTEQGLRYRIPFGGVEDVIGYLRDHATEAGDRVGMMGDDGEKFGAWPTTYEHCWGEGRWVDRFFEALEANADWLTTVTPSQWLEREPPIGRVYVPTSSYSEMGEWALPANEGAQFTEILHHAQAARLPEVRWLRGGFWRNFQVKYREINDLHKQMLRTSEKVASMADGPAKAAARDHLHRGQSNDCYWHGLFGGIYISHMRLATCEHLIAAEDAADAELGSLVAAYTRDLDMDGLPEALLAGPGQVVCVKPTEGGAIGAWDVRAARHALASVMRRRPEAYHDALRRHDAGGGGPTPAGDGPVSIHDIVLVKEPNLSDHLRYDDHERRSGLVRFLTPDATAETIARATAEELGDLRDGTFEVVSLDEGRMVLRRAGMVRGMDGALQPVVATKTIALGGGRLDPSLEVTVVIEHRGTAPVETRLGMEWSLHLLGGGGNPSAWYDHEGVRTAHDGTGEAASTAGIGFGNDWVGVAVDATFDAPADAWWFPIETVSNSEAGYERVYQGSALLVSRLVRLAPGERTTIGVRHAVSVARDRATEEAASSAAATPR
jgi:alpha-amylase